MLITKDFVMLNFPKTGSTFARSVLKKIYQGKWENHQILKYLYKIGLLQPKFIDLKLPNIKMPDNRVDQHGTFSQIPVKYQNRAVVSIIRSPYSRFISTFEFKAWANPQQYPISKEQILGHFPHFPNLDIDDYVDLCSLSERTRLEYNGNDGENTKKLGLQTILFMQMFFKNSQRAIERIDDDYIYSGNYKADMGPIVFLRQEHLREDLVKFLSNFDLDIRHEDLILNFENQNVTKRRAKDRNALWSNKALEYVTYRERYLIYILKEHGITYSAPNFL